MFDGKHSKIKADYARVGSFFSIIGAVVRIIWSCRLILLAIGVLALVRCGADEMPEIGNALSPVQYPGAPVITLKKTSLTKDDFDWMILHYRLEANDPLPFDIDVQLAVRGKSRRQKVNRYGVDLQERSYEIWGLGHSHKLYSVNSLPRKDHDPLRDGEIPHLPLADILIDQSYRDGQDVYHSHFGGIHHQIQSGRSLFGAEIHAQNIKYNMGYGISSSVVHLDSLTLSIVPWNGIGDAPYNVGSPHTITVKR
jgi:hypothetical protein